MSPKGAKVPIGGTNTVFVTLLFVWNLVASVVAFPDVPDCGVTETVGEKVLVETEIDASDLEEIFLDLSPHEGVIFAVSTGGSVRRRTKRNRALQLDFGGLDLCFGSDDDDGDDLIAQPNFNDEVMDENDCDYEDDDNEVNEQSQPDSGSQQVTVEIMDALSGVLSRKVPFSVSNENSDFVMWGRGQKSQCGHPKSVRVTGQEGKGFVEVTAYTLRNSPEFNAAALTFEEAIDVGSANSKKEWCGSVNLITHDPDPSCNERSNTPKWKVFLNQDDELQAAAALQCREDVAESSASKVELKIFRASDTETPVETIIDARIVGRKVKRGSFVNNGAGGWFYVELFRSRRHLYEYGITFEVRSGCADEKGGKFVLPKDDKTCGWLATLPADEIGDICRSSKSNADTQCRRTCGSPSSSESSSTHFHIRERNCSYLRKKRAKLEEKGKFERYCGVSVAGTTCPDTCGKCDK